jgi:hypothetical protein
MVLITKAMGTAINAPKIPRKLIPRMNEKTIRIGLIFVVLPMIKGETI